MNVGKIAGKIIVHIIHDLDTHYFTIRPGNDTVVATVGYPPTVLYENEERSIVCTLIPNDVAQILVEFCPIDVGRQHAKVRLLVVDNPYENMTIDLEGEGFIEYVVIDGLPLVNIPRSSSTQIGVTNRTRKSLKHRHGTSRAGYYSIRTKSYQYNRIAIEFFDA